MRLEPRKQCFGIVYYNLRFLFLVFFYTPQVGVTSKPGFPDAGRSRHEWKPQLLELGDPGRAQGEGQLAGRVLGFCM